MASERLVRLRALADTCRALDFEVNFSSVDAYFAEGTDRANAYMLLVRQEFGRSVTFDPVTMDGRTRVRMSLGPMKDAT